MDIFSSITCSSITCKLREHKCCYTIMRRGFIYIHFLYMYHRYHRCQNKSFPGALDSYWPIINLVGNANYFKITQTQMCWFCPLPWSICKFFEHHRTSLLLLDISCYNPEVHFVCKYLQTAAHTYEPCQDEFEHSFPLTLITSEIPNTNAYLPSFHQRKAPWLNNTCTATETWQFQSLGPGEGSGACEPCEAHHFLLERSHPPSQGPSHVLSYSHLEHTRLPSWSL
jgi:hypothetical protein